MSAPYLADVVVAGAHRGRARPVRRAARVEERVVLRERVPASRRDCDKDERTYINEFLIPSLNNVRVSQHSRSHTLVGVTL